MSRSLTGGTGDVNPQWYKITVTQSGNDTTTTSANPLPVPRLQNNKKPTIMELLKIYWIVPETIEVDSSIQAFLSTKNFSTTAPSQVDGTLIDTLFQTVRLTTSGMYYNTAPIIHDVTDGAGHGLLVATDNIYLQLSSAGTSAANVAYCWLLYRMKEVTLAEYIGIVQSQQS